jgi:hypothetical protein
VPLFRVQLRGENFLLNFTGEPELLGFEVTHFIKAAEEEARRVGLIQVRKDRRLSSALLNPPQNPTRLRCIGIKQVWWRRASIDGRYTFHRMEPVEGTADVRITPAAEG